eukprot:scaffold679_cov32-Tisochrysis_lutea.AAC.2
MPAEAEALLRAINSHIPSHENGTCGGSTTGGIAGTPLYGGCTEPAVGVRAIIGSCVNVVACRRLPRIGACSLIACSPRDASEGSLGGHCS